MRKLLFLLLLLAVFAVNGQAAEFGYHTIAGTSGAFNGTINCTRFTVAEAGTITKISVYISVSAGAANFRAAIYSNNGSNRPSALLAQAAANTVNPSVGWADSTVSYVFTAGTYWLCSWADSPNIENPYDTPGVGTNQSSASTIGTYPTFPATVDDLFALDRQYSIYATYTPSASGSGGLLMMGVGK